MCQDFLPRRPSMHAPPLHKLTQMTSLRYMPSQNVFWGVGCGGSTAVAWERTASGAHKYSGISKDIWDRSAVGRERAMSGAHKYTGISEGIWDRSAVAQERARGCPGARRRLSRSTTLHYHVYLGLERSKPNKVVGGSPEQKWLRCGPKVIQQVVT